MQSEFARLRRTEARLRTLLAATVSDVWVTDAAGRVVVDLPGWRRVTHQSERDIAGFGWLDGIHPGDRDRVAATWAAAVAAQGPYSCEYRLCPVDVPPPQAERDGLVRVVSARGVPLQVDGQVEEYVGWCVDVTAQRETEAARQRLADLATAAADRSRRLQDVTAALSRALTHDQVVTVILEQGSDALGAVGSGVALLEPDRRTVRYTLLNGYDEQVAEQWRTFEVSRVSPVTEVLRTGVPLFVSGPAELLARFPSREIAQFVAVSQEQAWVRLPLRDRGEVVGVLSLGWLHQRTWSPEERSFLLTLGGLCEQALERADLYERERSTARLLQHSLLPERLPEVAGLALAARLRVGTVGVEVGGDWYDVLRLPDGRLLLALGDVMGKGARAAGVMGQVRNALRAYVVLDPDPAVVLDRLDAMLGALADDEELVTLVVTVLDPATGRFAMASAGHPPALIAAADGTVREVSAGRSLPLGLGERQRPSYAGQLRSGDSLVMVSDGLLETRARGLDEGLTGLRNALAEGAAAGLPADNLCDRLVAVLGCDRVVDDDVTVLLCQRSSGPPTVSTDTGLLPRPRDEPTVPPSRPAPMV